MPLTLKRIVDASLEPITVAQAKSQCRIDFPDDDALFAIYIKAARQYAEKKTNRSFLHQTWRLSLDTFPWYGSTSLKPGKRNGYALAQELFSAGLSILLPRPNLIAVTSVTYLDSTGTRIVIDPSLYVVDAESEPARILPLPGTYWPYPAIYQPNTVQITYTAGYGPLASDVPSTITLAILMLVAHFYENREASTATALLNVPIGVDALLGDEVFTAFTFEV